MKTLIFKTLISVALMVYLSVATHAQQTRLQYFVPNSQEGLNQFESSKDSDVPFDGLKVWVGGDFAIQFQGLSQTNSGDSLPELTSNFNLPTANLNLDVQLDDGLRMHLRTYLSSRHHTEAYVKGGYLQMDKLDFVNEGFLAGLMDFTTIKVGMDEINYGDTHFRRTDNAHALLNPFVGNYIMDAFTTEPFAELTLQPSDFLVVVGASNGRLNQKPTPGDDGVALYAKLGYDSDLGDNLRLRLTGSIYHSTKSGTRDYIYGGDRAGSRYYEVLDASDFSGRYNPRFAYMTAIQINPFVKFQGLEVFGVLEFANNGDAEVGGGFNQFGAEALYRFGGSEQLYVGGRYNTVSGENTEDGATRKLDRLNVGGGWFMTPNVLTKLEYVKQTLDGDAWTGTSMQGAAFKGIMIEATIGF